jgi:ATPase family associated with various cellular activities (AAA)
VSFIRIGNTFRMGMGDLIETHKELPASTYALAEDPMTQVFVLEKGDPFELPSKIYGDTVKYANRILNTFESRENSTGVLLAGEKGAGKSMLAKLLSTNGISRNYPTVIVNAPYAGDSFNKFVQDIKQPAIFLFDEFEKVYDQQHQEMLLTLLDGTFPSKKLFVLTCNDKWRIDDHMRNRPGRIFYMLDFIGIKSDFVREYCEDCLNDKSQIDEVIRVSGMFSSFNFDMLKALVEEMNRYNESAIDSIKMLNAKPQYSSGVEYLVQVEYDGEVVLPRNVYTKTWSGNPMKDKMTINFNTYNKKPKKKKSMKIQRDRDLHEILRSHHDEISPDDVDDAPASAGVSYHTITFVPNDIERYDNYSQSYKYFKDKTKVILTKEVVSDFDYSRAY